MSEIKVTSGKQSAFLAAESHLASHLLWATAFWSPIFPPSKLRCLLTINFGFSLFFSLWFCWQYCILIYYNLDHTVFSLNLSVEGIKHTIMSRPGQIFLQSFATSSSFSTLTFSYVFIIFISYVFIRRLNAFKRPLEFTSLTTVLRTCLVMLRATRGSSSGSPRICVIHHKKVTNNG